MFVTPLYYSRDHQWVDATTPQAAIVGITPHAQDVLGDVVFVDLPKIGTTLAQGDIACVVESVKAAADVYMPIGGEITEVNESLRDNPAQANSDPLGEGWFFKIKMTDLSQLNSLMDESTYTAFAQNN